MKKIRKYATGDEIPEGAIFLSTQVETFTEVQTHNGDTRTINEYVWHYFLVEVKE